MNLDCRRGVCHGVVVHVRIKVSEASWREYIMLAVSKWSPMPTFSWPEMIVTFSRFG